MKKFTEMKRILSQARRFRELSAAYRDQEDLGLAKFYSSKAARLEKKCKKIRFRS